MFFGNTRKRGKTGTYWIGIWYNVRVFLYFSLSFRGKGDTYMKYCTECGAKRGEEQAFCTECGTPYSKSEQEAKPVQQSESHMPPPPKQPVSKRTKVILCVVGGILLILFGMYQWLSAYYDPVKVLQEMDNAMTEGNSEAFLKHIEFDKKALLHKEEYFAYIQKHEWKTVKPQLLKMMESKHDTTFDFMVQSDFGVDLYKVKLKKKLGLFPTYTFRALPTTLTVASTMEKTVFTIDKKEFNIDGISGVEIAKIYPGTYKYEATANNLFGDFKQVDEFSVGSPEEYEFIVRFPTETYEIVSDQMDATLFVNGKSTGKTLKELKKVGPFPDNTEVKMHAEWKNPQGKVMKTKTVTQFDEYWFSMYFEFGYAEEIDSTSYSPGNHVFNFRNAYEKALNAKDYRLIEPFIEVGSAAEKELKKFISDLDDIEFHYEFTQNEIINQEMIAENSYNVTTKEKFTYTHYEKEKDEKTDYEREKVYHVKATENGYKITKIDYSETDRSKH